MRFGFLDRATRFGLPFCREATKADSPAPAPVSDHVPDPKKSTEDAKREAKLLLEQKRREAKKARREARKVGKLATLRVRY
jgi:hypothetical protein